MPTQFRAELDRERIAFQASVPPDIAALWARQPGRTGVVLSGGGARGAYEAGVLLAFQDAQLPTHILAATSVGSINAASYAAHSKSLVGNAEHLVDSWSEVTPPAVGIDWSRYILVLVGFTAMTAGFGNFAIEWLSAREIFMHSRFPMLSWLVLGMTGAAFLYFHDHVSYLWHVAKKYWRRRKRLDGWTPDRTKVLKSIIANGIVWGCIAVLLAVSHVHLAAIEAFYVDWTAGVVLLGAAALVSLSALAFLFRQRLSVLSHRFLRLPMRTGLFPNYERTRFLRSRIPVEGLKSSPIRVAMTAADVHTGTEMCFVNASREVLLADPAVHREFIARDAAWPEDLMLAVIASSAFPIVYEAVTLGDGLWTDGGIVSNQPIRPAIRLGANVLFLVLVEPRTQKRGEIRTFLDLGVRAIDTLMAQNLKTDQHILNSVNSLCEHYAAEAGLRPEQVVLCIGKRRYRYLKAITVEPSEPVVSAVLDFDGKTAAPAILQGYRDGIHAVRQYAAYLQQLPTELPQEEIRVVGKPAAAIAGA